jgi:quinol monooxygenase YgiN
MSLRVVAHVTALPEKADECKALLVSLVEPTRQELGCISYTLYQNNANPLEFTFVEKWVDDASLDAHMHTPHIQAALGKITSLVAGPPDIRRYTRVV